MTSTYALRSHKSLKRDSPPLAEKYPKSSIAAQSNTVKSTFLSPTLFKKFSNLATRTPKRMSVSPSKSSASMPRKKGGILSKKLIKTVQTAADGISASLKPKTPTHHVTFASAIPAAPRTAPSKMEHSTVNLDGIQPPNFTVWEDPSLEDTQIDGAEMDLDAVANLTPSEESEELEPVDPVEEVKENKEPLIESNGTTFAPTTHLPPPIPTLPGSTRQAFADLKVAGMQEYQDLLGKAFQVALSPKTMFYRGLAVPATVTSASLKFPFTGLNYSKDLLPPSKLTRTHGSQHFRATSVNLFNKSAVKDTMILDSLSPSTPHKMPQHIDGSRLLQKRLFATTMPRMFEEKGVKADVDVDVAATGSYNLRPRTTRGGGKESLPPLPRKKRADAHRKQTAAV